MNPNSIALRRRGLLATVALATLLNLAASPAVRADANLVRVDVLDRDNGDALRVWRDHGRPVIAGRPGSRYSVRLFNDSGERVLAVVAIDGVNVVSGETASVSQRGYVLGPWQRTEITGWRKSDSEVAAFEFTALADSYAARTGRPLDVGVIGVAVFREAPRIAVSRDLPMPTPEVPLAPRLGFAESARAPPPAPALRAADGAIAADVPQPPAAERLGTGHGARETSVSRLVAFERASSQPDQRVEIRYDSLDNLVAAGIVPPPRMATTTRPHSFPADPPRDYVPDPPLR